MEDLEAGRESGYIPTPSILLLTARPAHPRVWWLGLKGSMVGPIFPVPGSDGYPPSKDDHLFAHGFKPERENLFFTLK